MSVPVSRPRSRRAGRQRQDVLAAAARVIAERGVDQTRFADVSREAGVPISTLQYSFGSREDLLLAAFDQAWRTEREQLTAQVSAVAAPWERLRAVVAAGIQGFGDDDIRGRLWLESVRLGMRDPETRDDVIADYDGWRSLLADAVRAGTEAGIFRPALAAEDAAVVILAMIDGVGPAIALDDPRLAGTAAVDLVLSAVAVLLGLRDGPTA